MDILVGLDKTICIKTIFKTISIAMDRDISTRHPKIGQLQR